MWGWRLRELGFMEWPFPCTAAALAPSRLLSLGTPCSVGTLQRAVCPYGFIWTKEFRKNCHFFKHGSESGSHFHLGLLGNNCSEKGKLQAGFLCPAAQGFKSATVEVAKHRRKMGEMRPELQGWTGISKVTPITIGCFLIITFSCTSLWISHSKMKQKHLKVTKKICIFTLYCFAVTCNPYFPSLFCIINAKFLFQVISALWVLPP